MSDREPVDPSRSDPVAPEPTGNAGAPAGETGLLGLPAEADVSASPPPGLPIARGSSLNASEEPFRELFETASDMIVILDPSGRIAFANRAFRTAIGLGDTPLPSATLVDLVHPYDHAACQAWLRQNAAGPSGARIRLVLRTTDGRELPVEGSATARLDGGRVAFLHGVFFDLSEQERAAFQQRQTGELFHLLSQHAPWGVFITDAAGRLRYANRRWRALADLVHVPEPRGVWWQMVHPGDRDRVLAQWQSALAGGHEFASEFRVNQPSQDPRWVRTRIAQSWNLDGRLDACVGITEDITLQRQADEVLRQAHDQLEELVHSRTEELQQTNRELTSLVYAVTHDLKAPLRGMSRLADWLAEDHAAALGAEGGALIVKLQARVRQLHALIDGILAYSRIGRTSEPNLPVDLNVVISEISRLIDPPAAFSIRVPESLPTVSGVPHQLHQLFQNLIENAMKFMDKPQGWVHVSCRRHGPAWEFSVADNGPGIPERFHSKVFDLFQRLETRPDRNGTGIGLTLVKRIVETRGGIIAIASEEGHGTTFRFTWPDQPPKRSA
jgi:PAS domain S-box-containing protein